MRVLVLLLTAGATCSLLPLEVERLNASVGGYAVMNCHLDFPFGNEIPYHLQWDKDGELILSWYSGEGGGSARVGDRWGGRVRRVADGRGGLGRGSLNVSSLRDSDAGLYRCRVAFPNRSPPERHNGTFYHLDVEGGNLIVTPPMNVTVLEGERAELECLPKSAEAVVHWSRAGISLADLPELAARVEASRNGSLVFRSTQAADGGEYQCVVRDPDGYSQSASAFLDVQYKAKVVYAPAERFLRLGKPASLDCHFSANPPLTNLRWEKDGFLFDPYNVPGVFYSRNGSLLFNQVDESHEGSYSCTAYNALGSGGAGAGVRVRVVRPAALGVRPRALLAARLAATLRLPCAARAHPHQPPPTISWTRKDGSPLPEGRYSLSGGNLTIESVAAEDAGVYVCKAVEEGAEETDPVSDDAIAETEVILENAPPRAPHHLIATPSVDSVHLSWDPGHRNVEVDYQVWYRERAGREWRTMKILSRGVTEATLVGLRPAARYELRVLAQDHIGDGLFSKPLYVTTLGTDPEDVGVTAFVAATEMTTETDQMEGVSELTVSVRLVDDGALLRWYREEGVAAGGCTVRWYQGPPPGDRLLATAYTDHDYMLVDEVEEGGEYSVRVQCAGGAGRGAVRVPAWAARRAAAAGVAGGGALLALLAAGALLLRRRGLRKH